MVGSEQRKSKQEELILMKRIYLMYSDAQQQLMEGITRILTPFWEELMEFVCSRTLKL